jgi:ribosome-associated protein
MNDAAVAGLAESDPGPTLVTDSRRLALCLANAAFDKKAENIVVIDVSKRSSFADFFVICTGRSDRHVLAVAEELREQSRKRFGVMPLGVEGLERGQWVLADFGAVIAHVFYEPVRRFYDLEGLWSDAPHVDLTFDAGEAKVIALR